MNRRTLLQTAALLPLAACAGSSVTPAQIIADAQGLVDTVGQTVAAVVATDPGAISAATQAKLAALGAAATAALKSLSAGMPAGQGAALLQTVDAYLNAALAALGAALPAAAAAFPALAPYIPIYDAGVALVTGVIEPYIASLIPAAPAPALKTLGPQVSVPAARARLRIK